MDSSTPPPPATFNTTSFSDPFVFPLRSTHSHVVIFLHGRGDQSKNFGPLFAGFSSGRTDKSLAALYPHTKFLFPTCGPVFSRTFKRHMTQWFDSYHAHAEESYVDSQLESFKAVVTHVHELIRHEIEDGTPPENILLGGISQGCAAALLALLMGSEQLGGFVGISGWMPFAGSVRSVIMEAAGNHWGQASYEEVPDESDTDVEEPVWEVDESVKLEKIKEIARKLKLDPPPEDELIRNMLRTPVWLGHSDDDQTVEYSEGRKIYRGVKALGMDVEWKRYTEVGHWYKVPEEIDDIVNFWNTKCNMWSQS